MRTSSLLTIFIVLPSYAFAATSEERLLGKAAIALALLLLWWLGSIAKQPKNVPANAFVNGNEWYCKAGYKRNYQTNKCDRLQ